MLLGANEPQGFNPRSDQNEAHGTNLAYYKINCDIASLQKVYSLLAVLVIVF